MDGIRLMSEFSQRRKLFLTILRFKTTKPPEVTENERHRENWRVDNKTLRLTETEHNDWRQI